MYDIENHPARASFALRRHCQSLRPGLTGQELLEQVRLNEKTKKTPFIMLTAEGEQEKVLKAIQAGVTNYIVKPFTAEILYKKIRPFLPPKILANVDRL